MKKIIISLIYIIPVLTFGQERYQWYRGEKILYQTTNPYKKYLLVGENITKEVLTVKLGDDWSILSYVPRNTSSFIPLKKIEKSYCVTIQSHKKGIKINDFDGLLYVSDFVSNVQEQDIGISELLYVELNTENDFDILKEQSNYFGTEIIGKVPLMSNWYILEYNHNLNKNDALDVANILYETRLFKNVSSSMVVGNYSNCVNDTYWGSQWGLNNTGQNGGTAGIDINFCGARTITSGNPNIVIAVLDHGIELNHPDLPNVLPGFDTESATTPSQVHGNHGTACGGIIGASSNNGVGISGIAPNCTLLSVSNDLYGVSSGDEERLALGINWSWQNGASVISNSWGDNCLQNPIIDAAISDAINNGRSGLGTVVVFSSGNSNGNVIYPANSNPLILAVGAIDRCGIRSGRIDIVPNSCDPWCTTCAPASQFGTTLDVVAPGTNVPTTDRQGTNGYNTQSGSAGDYYLGFGGTSAACPHVAGLAALILSVNPCLKVEQVNDIIESTAQKLSSYTYSSTSGRPNGTWNNETGYGLIDAEAALQRALDILLQNETETGNRLVASMQTIRAGANVDPLFSSGNYVVASGANVEFKATESITLEDGFIAEAGSFFLAHIESFNDDCEEWNTPMLFKTDFREVKTATFNEEITVGKTKISPVFFPNPYNSDLYVKYVLKENKTVRVQVYDIAGKLLEDQTFNGHTGTNIHKVNTTYSSSAATIAHFCINGNCETFKLVRNND